jgi:hypothetical protein
VGEVAGSHLSAVFRDVSILQLKVDIIIIIIDNFSEIQYRCGVSVLA